MATKNLYSLPLFLLSIVLFCIADIVTTTNPNQYNSYELTRHPNFARRPFSSSSTSTNDEGHSGTLNDPLRDSELLDVVLVASVDGKFHALNRTSGLVLWSMPSFPPGQGTNHAFDFDNLTSLYPSTLAPLVRTVHNQPKSDFTLDGDDTVQIDDEVYIIEPQSGAIYILPSNPSSSQNPPLRRFPFTMPELVDMSPFSFSDPDGHSRLFVGRKETSMLVVELETGKIKASVGGECPWNPFDDFKEEDDGEEFELDLDELELDEDEEGKKPAQEKAKPTEVFIGRTDYHISIHTLPTYGGSRLRSPRMQNLSFSTYGPNNQDTLLQSSYTRTKDNSYIQSMPNGELFAFRAHNVQASSSEQDQISWAHQFSNPIVATFDVLKRPISAAPPNNTPDFHTFVLLQPQPLLTDFHPSLSQASSHGSLPNFDSAYVGLVQETDSLFAMSPKLFPFSAFGESGSRTRKMIDNAPGGVSEGVHAVDEKELPVDVDEVTKRRKLREQQQREQELMERKTQSADTCDLSDSSNVFDLRCLTGMWKFEGDAVSDDLSDGGVETKTEIAILEPQEEPRKLLDAPPSSSATSSPSSSASEAENISTTRPSGSDEGGVVSIDEPKGSHYHLISTPLFWKWEVLVALLVGFVGVIGVAAGRHMPSSSINHSVNSPKFDTAVEVTSVIPPSPPDNDTRDLPASVAQASGISFDTPAATVENTAVPVTPSPILDSPPLSSPPPPISSFPSDDVLPIPAPLPTPPISTEGDDSEGEADEAEGAENDTAELGGRKKKVRRKRGKKKKGGATALALRNPVDGEGGLDIVSPVNTPISPPIPNALVPSLPSQLSPWPPAPSLVVVPATPMPLAPAPVQELPALPPSTLVVSEAILGFGSHGTVVFRGSLQGRSVAVKRLLRDFVTLASREVSILQESDDHPNVIRYYYQETHGNFLYIALELCPGSLADVFENSGDLSLASVGLDEHEETRSKEEWREIRESIIGDPKKALKQITSGLRHLHALKLVHRDIKPQNILVAVGPGRNLASSSSASLSRGQNKSNRGSSYRMLISDFGLCKKLDLDQTSFLPTAQGAMGAGTFGWRAPEILRGEVKLDNSEETSSSKGSAGTVNGNSSSISSNSSTMSAGKDRPTRLTKSVDVFALGCLFYYMLTAGSHPFGDRFEREVNIIRGVKDLKGLEERYGEEGVDAADLIERMLNADSSKRPDTLSCLLHPFFWDSGRRLNFLQEASDRFEIMCRDPKDVHLLELEKDAFSIVGQDWHSRVDKLFIDNLGKFRKYDGKSVQDLLRALRNKKHHYQDLPDNVKRHLGAMPEGYLSYFTRRYPQLFLHVHGVISDSELRSEPIFRSYFELAE